MTRAYSAVVCPYSRLSQGRLNPTASCNDRTRVLNPARSRNIMSCISSPPFVRPRSAEGADRGQHDRPHREEEERWKDQEHEGEEHLEGSLASHLLGTHPAISPEVVRHATKRHPDRAPKPL